MDQPFSRLEILIGKENLNKLHTKNVAIFGLGGVGGNVCDALARSGIKHFTLIDHDVISISNINRQLIANYNTIGKYKVDVMKEHILNISLDADIKTLKCFYLPESKDIIDLSQFDYVIDAIDTVSSKLTIIETCINNNIPIISSMGTGNKIHPELLEITDISKTSICPLARIIRQELRKRNVNHVKVLYSKEKPIKPKTIIQNNNKVIPGSTSFVPPIAGTMIAGEVIRDFLQWK